MADQFHYTDPNHVCAVLVISRASVTRVFSTNMVRVRIMELIRCG